MLVHMSRYLMVLGWPGSSLHDLQIIIELTQQVVQIKSNICIYFIHSL